MARLPDSFVDEVRAADIISIVGKRVKLKKRGTEHYGLCPFHKEKSPSFTVSERENLFFCFGCHEGGDVIKFVMLSDGLQFKEALLQIADEVGIPIPRESPGNAVRDAHDALQAACDAAWKCYAEALPGSDSWTYMTSARGFNEKTVWSFGIGHAPRGQSYLSEKMPRLVKDLVSAGLITSSDGRTFDMLRNRVVIPVSTRTGKVVSFSGRVLDPAATPKYLSCKDSLIAKKGLLLFGLHVSRAATRESKCIHLVEGYFDVMAMYQVGRSNAVCSMGTSLTAAQAALLAKEAKTVVVLYDGDAPGQRAVREAVLQLLEAGAEPKVVTLRDGKDPCDAAMQDADGFCRALEDRQDGVEALIRAAFPEPSKMGVQERSAVASKLSVDFSRCRDEVVADAALQLLAKVSGISVDALRSKAQPVEARARLQYKNTPNLSLSTSERLLLGLISSEPTALASLKNMSDVSIVEELPCGNMVGTLMSIEPARMSPPAAMAVMQDDDQRAVLHRSMAEYEGTRGMLDLASCWASIRETYRKSVLRQIQKAIEDAEASNSPHLDELVAMKADFLANGA